jgi:hypothetical protein
MDEAHIRAVLEANRDHYNFGTVENNAASFARWRTYWAALHELAAFCPDESVNRLQTASRQKHAFLDSIDFYVPDTQKDYYPCYLEGIWQQVAWIDGAARADLIKAYRGEIASPVAPCAVKLQDILQWFAE